MSGHVGGLMQPCGETQRGGAQPGHAAQEG